MITTTPIVPSGSTKGEPIEITTGTAIHTCSTTTTDYDEVWLWCASDGSVASDLTLTIAAVVYSIETVSPSDGAVLVLPGVRFVGHAAAVAITATSSTGADLQMVGNINRISTA